MAILCIIKHLCFFFFLCISDCMIAGKNQNKAWTALKKLVNENLPCVCRIQKYIYLCVLTFPRCSKAESVQISPMLVTYMRQDIVVPSSLSSLTHSWDTSFPPWGKSLQRLNWPVIWKSINHSDNLANILAFLQWNLTTLYCHFVLLPAGYIFLIHFNGEAPHFMRVKLLQWWLLLLFHFLRCTSASSLRVWFTS